MSTDTTTRRPWPDVDATDDRAYCNACEAASPLRYAETAHATRSIIIGHNAQVWIDHDEEVFTDGVDEHAECRTCLAEYELPEGFDYL